MSVATTNRVWQQSKQGKTSLLLLLAMADWSDDWGYCHPSLDQMAAKCRQTERNVITLIDTLEKKGELRSMARGKRGRGKKGSATIYQVTTGLTKEQIIQSQMQSPLCVSTLEAISNGQMDKITRQRKKKTDENFSRENFSGEKTHEKQRRDSSPVSNIKNDSPLSVNVSDLTTTTPTPQARKAASNSTNTAAESLYCAVRPSHMTLPNSSSLDRALRVLGIYLERYGSEAEAAKALKPFVVEADKRKISPTNLCWLTEWAAVGEIPAKKVVPAKRGNGVHHSGASALNDNPNLWAGDWPDPEFVRQIELGNRFANELSMRRILAQSKALKYLDSELQKLYADDPAELERAVKANPTEREAWLEKAWREKAGVA